MRCHRWRGRVDGECGRCGPDEPRMCGWMWVVSECSSGPSWDGSGTAAPPLAQRRAHSTCRRCSGCTAACSAEHMRLTVRHDGLLSPRCSRPPPSGTWEWRRSAACRGRVCQLHCHAHSRVGADAAQSVEHVQPSAPPALPIQSTSGTAVTHSPARVRPCKDRACGEVTAEWWTWTECPRLRCVQPPGVDPTGPNAEPFHRSGPGYAPVYDSRLRCPAPRARTTHRTRCVGAVTVRWTPSPDSADIPIETDLLWTLSGPLVRRAQPLDHGGVGWTHCPPPLSLWLCVECCLTA